MEISDKEKQKKNWAWERMQKIILETDGRRPTLLLHACCAPCSSSVLETLAAHFRIEIHYYNPNIYPRAEYFRRLRELREFLPAFMRDVTLSESPYNPGEFYEAVEIKTHPERIAEEERGERCRACYTLRMKKAYEYASRNGFAFFTTTLSVSPHKDSNAVNEIGFALEEEASKSPLKNPPRFLFADFKKKNGYKRSVELSKLFNLYRQDYCGCVYSKHAQKLKKRHFADSYESSPLNDPALTASRERDFELYAVSSRLSS